MTQLAKDKLQSYVLDATANDYESVSSIGPDLKKWAAEDKVSFSTEDLTAAVEELVRRGKLKAYRYSKANNRYESVEFSREEIANLWFSSR